MENKFKAGDKVKFINFDNENSSSWENKVNKNNVYIINHVGSYIWNKDGRKPCVCISELYGGWIPESCIELYVEISKFEIGKWYEFNSNNLQIGKCIKTETDNIKFFPWIINKDNLCASEGNFVPSKIQLIRELKGDDECILKFFPKIFTSLANPLFKFNIGDEIEGDKTKGHHYCTPEDFNRHYKIGGSEYIGADFTESVVKNRKCINGINWYTNGNNWWTEDALKSVKPIENNAFPIDKIENRIKELEIPKYVKVKPNYFIEKEEIDKIYDTSKPFPTHLKHCESKTWQEVLIGKNSCKFFIPINYEEYQKTFISPTEYTGLTGTIKIGSGVQNISTNNYDLVMGTGMALCSIGIDPYKKELTQKEKLHIKTNIKIINEDVNPIKSIQLQLKTKQKSIKF